jgi:hypothetical protein
MAKVTTPVVTAVTVLATVPATAVVVERHHRWCVIPIVGSP